MAELGETYVPAQKMAVELWYFTDPMCSWCYGFAPELDKVADRFAANFPIQIIPGGLRPSETQPVRPQLARYVEQEWAKIESTTGRPFDTTFFERHPDFVYNTRPACKAVSVAVRQGRDRARAYLDRLQEAFYAEGRDPNAVEVQTDVAEAAGFDGDEFRAELLAPEADEWVAADFRQAREANVMGYPTLFLRIGDRLRLVTVGWQKAEHLIRVIEAQLARNDVELAAVEGGFCSLDGVC